MNVKKKKPIVSILAAAGLSLTLLAGCGSSDAGSAASTEAAAAQTAASEGTTEEAAQASIDPAKVVADLVASGAYSGTMTQLDNSLISSIYGIPEDSYTDAVVYVGDGTTTETAAVFTTADEDAAKSLQDMLSSYVSDQIETYQDYDPDEVTKLEAATVETNGAYVLCCIPADGDAAAGIIDSEFR
ncbi:MAG: DUF4358 domain-containing protein [Lachnospiraceae bacterium]